MNLFIKFLAWILLIGLFYISCKKEYSCENCKGNKPPIANAGADQITILPKDSVILDGSASSDPDGTIVKYKWIKISGPLSFNIRTADSSKTFVKTLVMGVYKFELTVTDNGGLSAKDTVQIIADDPAVNQPPIANAGIDQTITLPTDSALLNGTLSFDPDGTITSYKWTNISGPISLTFLNPDSAKTVVKTLTPGVYQFELTVTDNGGLSGKDTIQVTANTAVSYNLPPIAKAGNDTTIQSGQTSCTPVSITVNLNGSNSYDLDGNIVSYLWAGPGNITNPNSASTSVNGTFQGIVSFILKVTDNNGAFSYDTIKITIIPANRPLVPVQVTQIAALPQQASITTFKAVAIAGNKIVFAGGLPSNNYPATARVDIYNIPTDTWTTATLSQARFNIGVAVLGNKIFFAGGIVPRLSNGPPVDPVAAGTWYTSDVANFRSTVIDIYDVSTNTWSIDHLSNQRAPVGVTVNNKVIFAGSDVSYQSPVESSKIDVYDAGTWTTAVMSEPRDMNQPAVGNAKVYFPGGSRDFGYSQGFSGGISSRRIDIYDALTGSWSVDNLSMDRFWMGNIVANNKLYCGGGMIWDLSTSWWAETNSVEIRDLATNTTSFDCLHEAKTSWALKKDNKIIFLGGSAPDIFDLSTNSWSIGVLPQNIGGSIISYNNIIYTTDGKKVWKLDF